MTFDEFVTVSSAAEQKRPTLFATENDPPATRIEIDMAERDLGRSLPVDYLNFIARFGGGYFGLANVFSVHAGSEWNLVERQKWVRQRQPFLAISDDEAGGFYGYADDTSRIFYLYPSEAEAATLAYDDLFDFLTKTALRAS